VSGVVPELEMPAVLMESRQKESRSVKVEPSLSGVVEQILSFRTEQE